MNNEENSITAWVVVATIFTLVLIAAGMYACPQYDVYHQRLEGEAALAKSQAERKVQIQDAEGKREAAKYLAEAEVERAKGVAAANKIIGESLKGNDSYLRYLWINNLEKSESSGGQVIYVPTEANLPILEAGHRK